VASFPGIIGKKRGMTQVFSEDGNAIPVTVVELLPLVVTQVKTKEKDGYSAVQVGYVEAKAKHLTKAQQGHLSKNNLGLVRKLKEFRVADSSAWSIGDQIALADIIQDEQIVHVTGHSIGKGFQGGTKRWHFGRGPMSHGSKSHRLPGSIGAGTTPGRVFKGLHMATNMGNEKVTVRNLKVVRMMAERNVVLIKGAVPGVEGGLLTIMPKGPHQPQHQ
jgi:large subunit ribosomal protein L3